LGREASPLSVVIETKVHEVLRRSSGFFPALASFACANNLPVKTQTMKQTKMSRGVFIRKNDRDNFLLKQGRRGGTIN
jgi:hypothetical protein